MPTLVDEDQLLDDLADDAVTDENDDLPLPKPKRIKLDGVQYESTGHSLRSDRGFTVVDLTNEGDIDSGIGLADSSPINDHQPESCPHQNPRIRVQPSISNFPRSLWKDWRPPLPPVRECAALNELLQKRDRPQPGYFMVPLRDYRIYRPAGQPDRKSSANRQYELEPLHHLKKDLGCDYLLFDGIIMLDGVERYVQGVPFETLAIDGYGEPDVHTVSQNISIQSSISVTKHVWYLLQEPASDYLPYHQKFLWVADFTKHVVDYLAEHETVSLEHFRSRFSEWTSRTHGKFLVFQQWKDRFGSQSTDFRQAVVAYGSFLWKEAWSVVKNSHKDPLWSDINYIVDGNEQEKEQSPKVAGTGKTLVTPYVFDSFQHIAPLRRFFEKKKITGSRVSMVHKNRKRTLGFTNAQRIQQSARCGPLLLKSKLRVGDYIAVYPETATAWRDGAELWYAYIQHIQTDRKGPLFGVVWLYSASATTLAGGQYPFENELFLSSHCNCNEAPLRAKDIAGKVHISWLREGMIQADFNREAPHFFIRQKFDIEEHSFVTIKCSDFCCPCRTTTSTFDEALGKVSVGDTVLIPISPDGEPSLRPLDSYISSERILDTLEPAVVENFLQESQTVLVRRLIRRTACHGGQGAHRNELVWTDDFIEIDPALLGPSCSIRFFQENDGIPSPYNRGGSGNLWYITKRLIQTGQLENLQQPFPTGLNQGFDPSAPPPRPKMVGLDAFSGGGNFGRGLEEGMAVEFLYAIDWARNAVMTYRANCKNSTWVYWGSVNDYLVNVMDGSAVEHFAKVGEIDFIAAGSPCQGFSRLQRNTASESSLRNISMVASVAAYIDVYRPKYAVLENVVAMAKEQLGIFPQLLCTLVGMGYQVSQHLLDAWSVGDSQSRSRLFVTIAAPNLTPMPPPTLTHSHPPKTPGFSLGRNRANDQRFGERRFVPTPFRYVTAQQSMGDLPDIGDSHIQTCIKYPDHRTVSTEAGWTRNMIRHIPIHPPAQGAIDAIRTGAMPKPLADRFLEGGGMKAGPKSRSWKRIDRDGLTSTITTAPAAACAMAGRVVHWQQHRVLSIREARKAQGFDDGDVITGSPAEQWKIIGNSVSRATARALGMALQEAWLSNPLDSVAAAAAAAATALSPVSRGADSGDVAAAGDSKSSSPDVLAQPHVSVRVPVKIESARQARCKRNVAVVIDLTRD